MGKRIDELGAINGNVSMNKGLLGKQDSKPGKIKASDKQMISGTFNDRLKMSLGKGDMSGRLKMTGNPKGLQTSDTNASDRGYQSKSGLFGMTGITCKFKGKGPNGQGC